MGKHSERDHAVLSASAAHRWMHCTPSARLEEQFPNQDTEYSLEGTRAHEMAEMLLSGWQESGYQTIPSNSNVEDKEMYESVLPYVEYVSETYLSEKKRSSDTVLFLEQRLDMTSMIPEGFGTGDALIVGKDILHIIDLKYGKGVKVDAIGNEQLRCYAMAAYEMFKDLYEDINTIVLTIVQPRLDHVSIETCSLAELQGWVKSELIPKAALAYVGKGPYVPGEHCRFCKAGATCRARAEKNLEIARDEFTLPDLLSMEEIADILPRIKQVTKWAESVEKYALEEAKKGTVIPGYKLVEGRSVRMYTDQDKVIQELKKQDYPESMLYEPRKLLGISSMEKLLGKKLFKNYLEDKGLVVKPQGKPTLVPESDARKALMLDALKDFESL